ncbi:MAG TPA: response regulator [Gemmatimonadaceae bacterium]|nr:response regulator [Gemmatimonadaceae bacterium]
MPCRILLVEDSALVVHALTLLLELAGHQVGAAGSVAEAVARARVEPPDILLLDLTLPDGDGLQVLEALRAMDAAPPVTVALTGHEDRATIARCELAGCRAVLLKPVPTRELLARVAEWEGEVRAAR